MSSEVTERDRNAMLPELERSLADAKLGALDAGAQALATRYAQLLDDAVAADKYAKSLRVLSEAVRDYAGSLMPPQERELLAAWDQVSSALAEHSVASDLGPKLLAAMTALGLTPAGRGALKQVAPDNTGQLATPLRLLRSEAAGRCGA